MNRMVDWRVHLSDDDSLLDDIYLDIDFYHDIDIDIDVPVLAERAYLEM